MVASVLFVARPAYRRSLQLLEGYEPRSVRLETLFLVGKEYPVLVFPKGTPAGPIGDFLRGLGGWVLHEMDESRDLPTYTLIAIGAGEPIYLEGEDEAYREQLFRWGREFERRYNPPLHEEIRKMAEAPAILSRRE